MKQKRSVRPSELPDVPERRPRRHALPRLRHAYEHEAAHSESLTFPEPSLTAQDQLHNTNLKQLVERFGPNEIPHQQHRGMYGDFTSLTSLEDAVDALELAQAQFEQLPSYIREQFANDPHQLLQAFDQVDADANTARAMHALGFRREDGSSLLPHSGQAGSPDPATAKPDNAHPPQAPSVPSASGQADPQIGTPHHTQAAAPKNPAPEGGSSFSDPPPDRIFHSPE